MGESVDPYRHVDFITRKILQAWVERAHYDEIPWTPLERPLSQCRVAALSSAGVRLRQDDPFDREGERQNPWWGDPSFRRIPATAQSSDVAVDHLHIPTRFAEEDLGCVLPLGALRQLVDEGRIGSLAPEAYSFMGYLLDEEPFLKRSVPAIVDELLRDEVDLAIFFLV